MTATADILNAQEVLCSETFDTEILLGLAHQVRQFHKVAQTLRDAESKITSGSLADQDARLAALYWLQNKPAEALKVGKKAYAHPVAKLVMAKIAEEAGDFSTALEHYEAGAKQHKENAALNIGQIRILRKEALGFLSKDFSKEADEAKQAKNKDAARKESCTKMVYIYGLLQELNKWIGDKPNYHVEKGRWYIDSLPLYHDGVKFADAPSCYGDPASSYAQALACFCKALRTEPTHPEATAEIAVLLDFVSCKVPVISEADAAKAKSSDNTQSSGQGEEVLDEEAYFQMLCTLKPFFAGEPDAENPEKSMNDEYVKGLYQKLTPSSKHVYINACLNLAITMDDDGRFSEAVALCDAVLDVMPNNARAKLFRKSAQSSLSMYYSPEETKQSERLEAVLRVPVTDFELSVRSRNCLSKMNIKSLGDLVKRSESEMLAYKNFGETSLREIREMLASRNLRLGMMREDAATRAAIGRTAGRQKEEILDKPIDELELSVRSRKCMDNLGIRTVGDLASQSELDLATAKNFGRVSLNEIKKKLQEHGISLNDGK